MSTLLLLFNNNILPIFIAAGSGYLVGRTIKVSPRSISQVVFYIFAPSLVFNLLTTVQLSGQEISRMIGFATTLVILIGLVAWIVGRIFHLKRQMIIALVLTAMFCNAGNYGLSLTLFAFGKTALTYASLFFITNSTLTQTLGVVLASLGSMDLKNALLGMLKLPAIYAVVLAIVFNHLNWDLPLPAERAISLLGGAAVPALLVLMGIQLAQLKKMDGQKTALTLGSLLRLVVSPALGFALCFLFGLQGAARQAALIESAMPTAVMVTALATEYHIEPSFVSTTVLISTLLSPLTITPLLAYLGA